MSLILLFNQEEGEAPTSPVTYYWNDGLALWTEGAKMWDGILGNYAYTASDNTIQGAKSTTGPGTNLGAITKVEMRFYGYGDGDDQIGGYFTGGSLDDYLVTMPISADWSTYIDVTNDIHVNGWTWAKVADLYGTTSKYFEIQYAKVAGANTLYCAKVEIRITFTTGGVTRSYGYIF